MIPRIFHYVWLGGELPDRFRANIDTWTEHNPDFKVMAWTDETVDDSVPFIANALRLGLWARASNLVRLLALNTHGGVYLDTDVFVRQSFEPLLRFPCFVGFQTEKHDSDLVCNAVIGSEAGHWLVGTTAAEIMLNFDGTEQPVDSGLGPALLTKVLRAHDLPPYSACGVFCRDVFVAPTHYFYPYGWDEEPSAAQVGAETYAVHEWARSWFVSD